MSVASDRGKAKGATTRGRSSSNGSRNAKSSSSASTRARNTSARAKTKSSSGRSSRSPSKKTQSSSRRTQNSRRTQSSRGIQTSRGTQNSRRTQNAQRSQASQRNNHAGRDIWTNAGLSALTAAIGIAGGVALGRSTARHDRKVLGVPVPEKIDLGGISQQIGDAGRQFGKLASEVRTVREKAEQVGRILT